MYVYKSRWKRLAAFLFDFAGSVLFFLPRLRSRVFRPEEIRRILIVRLDQIGDVVLTRPAAAVLRAHFPLATIDWFVAAEAAPLLAHDTRVADTVFSIGATWFTKGGGFLKVVREFGEKRALLRARRYDLAFDFRGDLRNVFFLALLGIRWRAGYGITGGGFLLTHTQPYDFTQHQVEVNAGLLKSIGLSSEPIIPPFHYPASIEAGVLKMLEGMGKGKKIFIQTGAGYASKMWPQELFADLIKQIHDEKIGRMVLIGTEGERGLLNLADGLASKVQDLRGKTRVNELPALFDQAAVFIGNDSGPTHIAAAQGIPVICLFSAANPVSVWRPRGREVRILSRDIECSPCYSRICPLIHHQCMKDISVSEVMSVVKEYLSKDLRHAGI